MISGSCQCRSALLWGSQVNRVSWNQAVGSWDSRKKAGPGIFLLNLSPMASLLVWDSPRLQIELEMGNLCAVSSNSKGTVIAKWLLMSQVHLILEAAYLPAPLTHLLSGSPLGGGRPCLLLTLCSAILVGLREPNGMSEIESGSIDFIAHRARVPSTV